MSEICLDCWNKHNETQDKKWRYILSWGPDLCEACGRYKRVIVTERLCSRAQRGLAEAIRRKQGKRMR